MSILIVQKGFDVANFEFTKAEDFKIETNENLIFSFGLSPRNDNKITNFIVDITNQVRNRESGVILSFKTRSTFQLSGFNDTPNLAILETLVYESYENHEKLFKYQVSTIDFLKNRTIARIKPELFEVSLSHEFNKTFTDN